MKKSNIFIMSIAALFITSVSASASSIASTTYNNGTTWSIDNIASWASTGNTIVGMSVTAFFGGGASEPISWATNTGVIGTGWSLTMPNPNTYGFNGYNDNTWYSDAWWNFQSTGAVITSLVFEGKPGNVVFDVYSGRNEPSTLDVNDTPGSDFGRSIIAAANDGSAVQVNAIYSNRVAINGYAPVGDLFHTLTLNFIQPFTSGSNFRFALDTDNVNETPVPEPATLLLFGAGLAGLSALRKRRKK